MSGWEAPKPSDQGIPPPAPADPGGSNSFRGVGCMSGFGLVFLFISVFLFSNRPSAQQPDGYEFMDGLRELITAMAQAFLFLGIALLVLAMVRVQLNERRANKDLGKNPRGE